MGRQYSKGHRKSVDGGGLKAFIMVFYVLFDDDNDDDDDVCVCVWFH